MWNWCTRLERPQALDQLPLGGGQRRALPCWTSDRTHTRTCCLCPRRRTRSPWHNRRRRRASRGARRLRPAFVSQACSCAAVGCFGHRHRRDLRNRIAFGLRGYELRSSRIGIELRRLRCVRAAPPAPMRRLRLRTDRPRRDIRSSTIPDEPLGIPSHRAELDRSPPPMPRTRCSERRWK